MVIYRHNAPSPFLFLLLILSLSLHFLQFLPVIPQAQHLSANATSFAHFFLFKYLSVMHQACYLELGTENLVAFFKKNTVTDLFPSCSFPFIVLECLHSSADDVFLNGC